MSLRRTILLEDIYRKVATPSELRKLDELYEKRAKGVATAMMTRRLVELLTYYIEKHGVPNKTPTSRVENPPSEQKSFNRIVKVNGQDVWW